MTIGEFIKEYRASHDLSQRQFARLCGLSSGYISMLESGQNPKTGCPIVPAISSLKKISAGMGLSAHEVISAIDDLSVDLGVTEEAAPIYESDLSEEEREIILRYRAASPEIRKAIQRIAEE